MGLFSALGNLFSSGGNFRFIAQNMAAIYSVIKGTSFGRSLDRSHLLFATALADVEGYFRVGQITEDDLSHAVSSALARSVSIDFYSKPAFNPLNPSDSYFDFHENMDLICLTMQVEAMVFTLSTRVDYHTVVDQVIAQKELIGNTINASLADVKRLKIYNAVYANVTAWASNPEFQRIVRAYKGVVETEGFLF